VNTPNIIGIIHSIIRLVDSCCGEVAGIEDIFCINHIDPPTKIGKSGAAGLLIENSAKFSHRKVPSSGTAVLTG
jgi:hypothetical protein